VGDEELGIGAVEDRHPDRAVGGQLLAEPVELLDERQIEEVDGRMVDGDERHPARQPHAQTLEAVVGHGRVLL
jgi:hypothetical protein